MDCLSASKLRPTCTHACTPSSLPPPPSPHLRRERGLEALGDPALQMPGRFLHLTAEDMRLRDVPDVLADYALLYASHASLADAAAGPSGGAAGAGAGAGSVGAGSTGRPSTPA